MSKREWQKVWKAVQEFAGLFPDDTVAIGGIAVYLHALQAKMPAEFTHDADFFVGSAVWGDVREVYDATPNRRLNKHQIVILGVEFDIYVERRNGLRLTYEEVSLHAVQILGVRVAALEHLLLLKLAALADRANSAHGSKDKRDVAKILILLHDTEPHLAVLHGTREDADLVGMVMRSGAFSEIADGNAHVASALKKRAAVYAEQYRKHF